MRRGPFIVLAGLLSVLIALCAAAFVYNATRPQVMADGLSVNGVPIGGLTRAQAESKLARALVAPLQKPVTILLPSGERTTLTPKGAGVRMNIASAVDEADRLSRQGSILERVWNDVTGVQQNRDLHAQMSYSRAAVRTAVNRIAGQVDTPAEDATVQPQGNVLVTAPGHDGSAVQRSILRRAIVRRLVHPEGSDRVSVPVKKLTPEVTQGDLGSQYPSYIMVDRGSFELRLYRNLKLARTYPIAVGQQGLETPAGLYDIQDKQVDPTWHVPESDWAGDLAGKTVPPGPDNPLKARWMGFNGAAGIHGTADIDSLGSAASHGCIRMAVSDVEDLYDQVSVGTPVYIQ
jgi:lipoprotein-anchoring transpeptidase ErfK/SrfK